MLRVPKNLLFIGINFSPENTGIAPYTAGMSRGLNAAGYEVNVITAHPHYPQWKIQPSYGEWTRREQINGVSVKRLRHFVPHPPKGLKRLISEVTFGLRAVFTKWPESQEIVLASPALISSAISMVKARIQKRHLPVKVWVQDLYARGLAETGQANGFTYKAMFKIEKWLLRSATKVVVIHERFKEIVEKDFGIAPEKVVVIRNWTHVNVEAPRATSETRERFGWGDKIIVLHTGNMGVKQGLQNVVESAKLAEAQGLPFLFVLLGDGGERTSLELAGSGVSTLKFVPPVSEVEYQSMLAAADVLLVNELVGVNEMAVPSKLTSYFNAGKPVLAAVAVDGITAEEVLKAQAGLVVPSGEPAQLIEAVLRIKADPVVATQLGKNGREFRLRYLSEESAVQSFIENVLED